MIDTVTLNPTFDRHLYITEFKAEKQNRVEREIVCAGGKGVNVSRVLTLLGAENEAVAAVGEYGKEEYLRLAEKSGVKVLPYTVKEQNVRTNIVVHPQNAPETGISTDTFSLSDEELERIFAMVNEEKAEYTVFSGRLPQGLSKPAVIKFLRRLIDGGTRLTVDSSSVTLKDLLKIKPWLIKPNRSEIKELGYTVTDVYSAKQAAEVLRSSGISNVIISLDGDGGVYVGEYGAYAVSVPKIDVPVSTVGAGDSTLAGFIASISKGEDIEKALALAFACGTAACMTEGTNPPLLSDMEIVSKKIILTKL